MNRWKKEEISSLKGKVFIVTGGNSGIGFETVKVLAYKEAHVIMASRDLTKAELAIASIKKDFPNADIRPMKVDLSSLASVERFTNDIKKDYRSLDGLVNNAGIMFGPFTKTEGGFESQIGTNHFGHFALTARLFPLLKASGDARVINVSSIAHKAGELDLKRLEMETEKTYNPSKAYSRSKLANLLFTYYLAKQVQERNLGIRVLAAHPGVSKTNLFARNVKWKGLYKFLYTISPLQSAQKGALPILRALLDPQAQNGEYYGPDGWFEIGGNPVRVKSIPASHDEKLQKEFWDYSIKKTGVRFDF